MTRWQPYSEERRLRAFHAKFAHAPDWSCWDWTGAISDNGYGRFWNGDGISQAHRWSYEQFVGPIPDGLTIDHMCDNSICVNPQHLKPATHRDNNLRGGSRAAVHARKTHCKNGHPFDDANTHFDRNGWRSCRTCARLSARRYKARQS